MKRTIIICTLFPLLFSGCLKKNSGPIHQTLEDVVKIELLAMSDDEETVLYTLSDDEMDDFWEGLLALRFRRYFNDPDTHPGRYAVRISYKNRYVDVIGMSLCVYYDPSGENQSGSKWYYVTDQEAFVQLLYQYIPSNVDTTGN